MCDNCTAHTRVYMAITRGGVRLAKIKSFSNLRMFLNSEGIFVFIMH